MNIENDEYMDDEWDQPDVETEFLTCPACQRDIYADSDKCPHCGHWITDDDLEADYHKRRQATGIYRVFLIMLGLLGLAGVLATILVLLGI